MSLPRLVFLTSRFWPIMDEPELTVGRMASSLCEQDFSIRMLTRRWDKRWSRSFEFRSIPVERLGFAPNNRFGEFRHLRYLVHWLKANQTEYDAVVCIGINDDTVTACKVASRFGRPSLIYDVQSGHSAEQIERRNVNIERLLRLNRQTPGCPLRILAASSRKLQELMSRGVPDELVDILPLGVALPSAQTSQERLVAKGNARAALALAHPIFAIDPLEPLVYHPGPLETGRGLLELVDAWSHVVRSFPRGKLWLLGDGPNHDAIWERIVHHDLVNSVLLVGAFDELHEVNKAADLMVAPYFVGSEDPNLLAAMAERVPVVTGTGSDIIRHRETGWVLKNTQPATIATMIVRLLEEPNQDVINNAFQHVSEFHSFDRSVQLLADAAHQLTDRVPGSSP